MLGTVRQTAEDFHYGEIKLQDADRIHALTLELEYLSSLEPDRLLAGFYITAGLEPKAERYKGWESTEIQGHTLGHYLTAIAQAYAYTGKKTYGNLSDYVVRCLRECQREDGYLFASPEEIFSRVEDKKPAWVPWYTMHKIVSGLTAAYMHTGNQEARQVAEKLGEWIYRRSMGWSQEMQRQVLSVEYGGMNDCMYELYRITGDERFAQAAHQFDEIPLFNSLYEGKDILNGLHANSTIPKILGALNRYICLGEEFYLKTAENFWDMVTEHHTYVTGGNSEWEHFGQSDILDRERTACNCETCNTYNMLKLTKRLFELAGERKYADYYANTVLNAILASQNPETGMTTYFQPMATGYFKVYGTPYDSFWCCTGSGMENFTKLAEGIAFRTEEGISVIRYEDCELDAEDMGLKLRIRCTEADDRFRVSVDVLKAAPASAAYGIKLLIPKWCGKELRISSEEIRTDRQKDWIILKPGLKKGDTALVEFSMELQTHSLPDSPHAVAFTYGPYVLSADLGTGNMDTTYTGVDVLVPRKEMLIPDYLVLEEDIEGIRENPARYLVKEKDKIEFYMENQGNRLVFAPHFSRYKERYGIYWLVYREGSQELKDHQERMQRRFSLEQEQADVIPVGNDQYELAHSIRGEKTDTDYVDGHICRFCQEEGWFSYEMKAEGRNGALCMTLASADAGSCFVLSLGEKLTKEITVADKGMKLYTEECRIPDECFSGNNTVAVKFQYRKGICRIFDELYLKKCGEKEQEEMK